MGRLRTIANACDLIKNNKYFVNDLSKFKFKYNIKYFLEIGCGKGQFLIKNALLFPQNIYLGIDKYATIIYKAIKKIDFLDNKSINNLFFANIDVIFLDKFIKKKHCFDKIYLNFSDPWPKKRHEKKRLTSLPFHKLYQKILKKQGNIEFKTDNLAFFEYTWNLLKINSKNIKVLKCCKNLHKYKNNSITTEYEDKFIKQDKQIYQIIWTYR